MGMRGHVQQKFLNDMIDSTGKIDSLRHLLDFVRYRSSSKLWLINLWSL